MILEVTHQERYSRGELLLRTFFGYFYIALPHLFLLFFVQMWSAILQFIAFWVILFTGRYPESMFEFQVQALRWNLRVSTRLYNLSDGYPAFGLSATDEQTQFEVGYPESVSRGLTLIRFLFGVFYVLLPHGFILIFRSYATLFLVFLGFWVVLFTGNYPESWHRFNVGTLRWSTRVSLYMAYMTDDYPPFSGKSDAELGLYNNAPETNNNLQD